MTPTATTASPAPPPWARSAARSGLPPSMRLDRGRPEILTPPEHPPACCTQQTITVPPEVAAKTRQKHDYPSPAHRRSYARRTGAERTFSTIKDPATTNIARGWCRLTGPPSAAPVAGLPAHHPQPAHPHRLGHPPGREHPPRRRRAPTQNQAPPAHNPRQPRHRPALAHRHKPGIPRSPSHPHRGSRTP